MSNLIQRLAYWLRGYSDNDILTLADKMQDAALCRSCEVIPLTGGEYKALQAGRVLRCHDGMWLVG